jgi:hypothetical protein
MTASAWRNLALALAAACAVLTYRTCAVGHRVAAERARCADLRFAAVAAPHRVTATGARPRSAGPETAPDDDTAPPADVAAWGFRAPGWVRSLAPQPGEDLLAYRDRMVPLAQAVVAPHRARVARGRDAFAAAAQLDAAQRAELDAAVQEAAGAIQDRAMQGILSGELLPGQVKPSTGVAFARDVLDAVDRANHRFDASLRPSQRAALAASSFDVADYLVFSTRWEDMLGVSE